MSASTIFNIKIECPRCGRENSITLGDMEAKKKVVCSSCRWPLGRGEELAERAPQADAEDESAAA